MQAVLTTYYDLKDENSLPQGTKFVDPYDNSTYVVLPRETLSSLSLRIAAHRTENNYPILTPEELKLLIVTFLVETCPDNIVKKYFVPIAIHPNLSQGISLVKTVVRHVLSGDTVPTLQRKNRAEHCLKCTLHQKNAVPPEIVDTVLNNIVANAVDAKEQKLGVCGMCGCGLAQKVKFELMNILTELTPEDFDKLLKTFGVKAFETCWITHEAIMDAAAKQLLRAKLKNGSAGGEELFKEYITNKVAESKNHG